MPRVAAVAFSCTATASRIALTISASVMSLSGLTDGGSAASASESAEAAGSATDFQRLFWGAGVPRRIPATLRSSSTSGQWMPSPSPRSCQFDRCAGDAWSRRGNQASGTLTLRPSTSDTVSSSSVTRTSCARGTASTTEELIPCLQKPLSILHHDTLDRAQFGSRKPASRSQPNRIQPEFGHFPLLLSVDVRRLGALVAVGKEPKGADLPERRHREIPPERRAADSCR